MKRAPITILAVLLAGCATTPPPTTRPVGDLSRAAGDSNCDRWPVVEHLRGGPGRVPGTCRWDRGPSCRHGCDDQGRASHQAAGSFNLDLNASMSRRDALAWARVALPEELNRGIWGHELGSSDTSYAGATQRAWMAALALATQAGDAQTAQLAQRRLWWGWVWWALHAVEQPRTRVTWYGPGVVSELGPAMYLGPGYRTWPPGMRWYLRPPALSTDDHGAMLSMALGLPGRDSRFGARDLAGRALRPGPWPMMESLRTWQKGPVLLGRGYPARAFGLAMTDAGEGNGNWRRSLLQSLIRGGNPYVLPMLAKILAIEGFHLYRFFRHGEPVENGAEVEITRFVDGGIESIWTGPVLTGNGGCGVAYSSIDAQGWHRIATPFARCQSGTRGDWRISVTPETVVMETVLPDQGGRVVVERLRGAVSSRVVASWRGLEVFR